MAIAATAGIVLIIALQTWFMVLEGYFWNRPLGKKTFAMTDEQAQFSAPLAMNQGLYNGFLAAGLIWGLATDQFQIKMFFLACVLIAGVVGGLTAKRAILYLQALPAAIALALVWLAAG